MTNYLIIVTIVIFACVFLSRVSNRLGIPALLFFIVLGMIFGSDGILKIPFDNYSFAEQICSIALIFIMFYGGFGTNWNQAKSVAVKSILLSTVGVVITFGLTGAFCHFALHISWTESLLIAAVSIWLLGRIKFTVAGFDTIFVVGIALLSYTLPSLVGGNGFLSAYIVGIVLGNTEIPNKRNLVNFFDGLTGLMQMLIFFLLGLLSFPSRIPHVIVPALLIAVWLTFIARPVAVSTVLTPFKSKLSQQLLVSWSGLRGAASIVFAIMATMAVKTENDIFHIVFMIVLFSILLQGSLLPFVAKKLHMIDQKADVMKTFNDYSDEVPVQFIQLTIPANHNWCGQSLKDLTLPPQTLIVLLKRAGKNIIPDGNTRLLEGDILILSATTPDFVEGVTLVEIHLDSESKYTDKLLSEIPKKRNELVIMIQRNDQIIIPNGNVRLEAGDLLVINRTANSGL